MATMNSGETSNNPFAEVAEKLRKEAYAQGWRDAVAALTKAAAEAADLDPASSSGSNQTPIDFTTGNREMIGITQGSTPWYVFQAVRKRHGMTGSEVVSVVQEGGHKVSDASIRTSLIRLERKKLIVSRHKKWFPV
jgi:hypothetical protein